MRHEAPGSLVAACLAVLFLTLSACSPAATQSAGPGAVPVVVATVVQKAIPVQVQAIGRVEAYSTVEVKSQVGGILTGVHFVEGQDVREGDLLFTIDKRSYQTSLDRAVATLARDRIQLSTAQENVRRYTDLVKKEYVTQEEYDRIKSEAEALEADVQADEANVENARLQLGYCTIRSPIAGRTGKLMVHPGNLIKANADTAMVTINQVEPIYVAFSVPEDDLPEIRRRASTGDLVADATPPENSGRAERGRLSFIDNAVDPATGTILLKATFANEIRALWPGQFVDVSLTLLVQPDAVLVPSQAVQTGQEGSYVFVVKEDRTVESRSVRTGRSVNGETVIESGLSKGETVVTDGQLRLAPGAMVEFRTGEGS